MPKIRNRTLNILSYILVEFIALGFSLVTSFLTWGYMLGPTPDNQADGFGYLYILVCGAPFWLFVAVGSPLLAHILFAEPIRGIWKRIGMSLSLPIIASVVFTIVLYRLLDL